MKLQFNFKNLTQLGKSHRHQAWRLEGLTDLEVFLDSAGVVAWPFLAGGVICLVKSDNERDSVLLHNVKADQGCSRGTGGCSRSVNGPHGWNVQAKATRLLLFRFER